MSVVYVYRRTANENVEEKEKGAGGGKMTERP
jgi:hypothetical protein